MIEKTQFIKKRALNWQILYFSAWVLFFILARIVFLGYHFQQTKTLDIQTIIKCFGYGFRLDCSAVAYICLLPFLFFCFLGQSKNIQKGIFIYTCLCLVLGSFLIFTDLELYRAWGYRIDTTFLTYLRSPKEMTASVGNSPVVLIFVGFCLFLAMWIYFFKQKILFFEAKKRTIWTFLASFLLTVALIIPLRGGLQQIPINQSSSYFSTIPFANHAAINAPWNVGNNAFLQDNEKINPFTFFDAAKADSLVLSLRNNAATSINVLRTEVKQPNILIIVWESATAKIVERLGGAKGVTPELDKLSHEGILFTNLYGTGDRTDKGIVGVLSGYPAQATTSILKTPRKTANLPILSKEFKQNGYETFFFYGGEPEFANMKSYILNGEFEHTVFKNDFSKTDCNSKWGAYDHIVCQRVLQDLNQAKQPFFSTFLTLTSHEPFETPVPTAIEGTDETARFLNAHHYTDASLGQFIANAKQQPWWDNTLIVILADHGHRLPVTNSKVSDFKIPMLWLGGALQQKDQIIDNVGSQTDLAATLLQQVALPKKQGNYFASKDLFNSTGFAFFSFKNGFGFVQKDKNFVFDNLGKQLIEQQGNNTSQDLDLGKALEQVYFEDYMRR